MMFRQKREIAWPSSYLRLQALSPTAYPAYRSGSSTLHGGWTALLLQDLRQVEGGFSLDHQLAPAVQPMTTAGMIITEAALRYLESDGDEAERYVFADRLGVVLEKLQTLEVAHEEWMQRLEQDEGSMAEGQMTPMAEGPD